MKNLREKLYSNLVTNGYDQVKKRIVIKIRLPFFTRKNKKTQEARNIITIKMNVNEL